jgi:hypothetical protein
MLDCCAAQLAVIAIIASITATASAQLAASTL